MCNVKVLIPLSISKAITECFGRALSLLHTPTSLKYTIHNYLKLYVLLHYFCVLLCVFMWEWMWGGMFVSRFLYTCYVEASGQAQVSFLRNAIYRFGFSLVVYWFWWWCLTLRKGLSLDYNLPIRLYWLPSKHQWSTCFCTCACKCKCVHTHARTHTHITQRAEITSPHDHAWILYMGSEDWTQVLKHFTN